MELEVNSLPWSVVVFEALVNTLGASVVLGILGGLACIVKTGAIHWGIIGLIVLVGVSWLVELCLIWRRLRKFTCIKVTPERLAYATGRWMLTETLVRRDAILSVERREGPLLKVFGLVRVQLFSNSQLPELPALPRALATEIQQALTAPEGRIMSTRASDRSD